MNRIALASTLMLVSLLTANLKAQITKSISGFVYIDYDGNTLYNGGDAPYPYPMVLPVSEETVSGTLHTKADGTYTFYTDYDGEIAVWQQAHPPCSPSIRPISYHVTLSPDSTVFTGKDFRVSFSDPFELVDSIHFIQAELPISRVKSDEPSLRHVVIRNSYHGISTPSSITILFNPQKEFFVSGPTVAQTDSSVTFAVPSLYPCDAMTIDYWMHATAPEGSILFEKYYFEDYTGQTGLGNATIKVNNNISPNNKMVNKDSTYNNYGDFFYYTINFQNTGNTTVNNVTIIDTLPVWLTAKFMYIESSSHPFDMYLHTANNVLELKFNNINLPNSETNQIASRGYVTFRIPNNAFFGSQIKNFADIYFDAYPPIRTNTTITDVMEYTGINETVTSNFSIYPNPTNTTAQLNFKKPLNGNIIIKVFSAEGKILQEVSYDLSNASTLMYDISALPNGVHYIGIENGTNQTTQKLVVIR